MKKETIRKIIDFIENQEKKAPTIKGSFLWKLVVQ